MLDLQPAADQMAAIVALIRDDQLGDPTPSEGRSVSDLLAHVHGLSVAFRDAARKIDGPTTSTSPTDGQLSLDPSWRSAIPKALSELVAAWAEPEAWEGMTMAGGLRMSGEECGAVANNEVVIHGWDLAVSTGQSFTASEENLRASFEFCSKVPDDSEARQGLFGPVVVVPEDAPLLDRTLGCAGRDPHWRPPPKG
jgi:uncharacterized protein (TIGR03086 family)